ncbi:MAG: FtsQ-type POTRA domain-containing protein, partial [Erysipelotrichaceae bacterium]|nr:FtsQ-type POTRA domain-containing protein [Erysipelotrichaceae bacterium]
MLDDKENLLQKNKLFNIRKDRKKKTAYEKARSFYFVLSIILSLVIIAATYFLSSVSNVYRISVDGNIYLKDEDIIQMSGLSEKSKYLLVMPFQVREKIKKNELIEDVKVERLEGRLVKISVKEKKIVGYAPENGLNVLIVDNGEKIGIGKDQMYLIASGPIIEGFDEEGLVTLAKQLNKCDSKIIKEISEIHRYPELKYQDVELVMRDGNYVFTSVYGINILEHYFDIESSYVSSGKSCYYFEDISGNAYIS